MKKLLLLLLAGCGGVDMTGLAMVPDSGIDDSGHVIKGGKPVSDAVEMVDVVVPMADLGAGGVTGSGGAVGAGGSSGAGAGGTVGAGGASTCVPVAEVCNGKDDDCDGVIDSEAVCPDFIRRDGHSYIFGAGSGTTWVAAREWCRQFGRDLATIQDQAEEDWISAQAASRSAGGRWLGVTDAAVEGTWLLTDGTRVLFFAWLTGQPNNNAPGGENCVALIPVSGGNPIAGWNDMRCNSGADSSGYALALCEAP